MKFSLTRRTELRLIQGLGFKEQRRRSSQGAEISTNYSCLLSVVLCASRIVNDAQANFSVHIDLPRLIVLPLPPIFQADDVSLMY